MDGVDGGGAGDRAGTGGDGDGHQRGVVGDEVAGGIFDQHRERGHRVVDGGLRRLREERELGGRAGDGKAVGSDGIERTVGRLQRVHPNDREGDVGECGDAADGRGGNVSGNQAAEGAAGDRKQHGGGVIGDQVAERIQHRHRGTGANHAAAGSIGGLLYKCQAARGGRG